MTVPDARRQPAARNRRVEAQRRQDRDDNTDALEVTQAGIPRGLQNLHEHDRKLALQLVLAPSLGPSERLTPPALESLVAAAHVIPAQAGEPPQPALFHEPWDPAGLRKSDTRQGSRARKPFLRSPPRAVCRIVQFGYHYVIADLKIQLAGEIAVRTTAVKIAKARSEQTPLFVSRQARKPTSRYLASGLFCCS